MKNLAKTIACAAVMGLASVANADDTSSAHPPLELTDQQMQVISAGGGRRCYRRCGSSIATAGADAHAYGKNTLASTGTYAVADRGFAGASSVSVAAAGQ